MKPLGLGQPAANQVDLAWEADARSAPDGSGAVVNSSMRAAATCTAVRARRGRATSTNCRTSSSALPSAARATARLALRSCRPDTGGRSPPNAHLYETGRMRRTHVRGHANILKRLLVHVGGFNLRLLRRTPSSVWGRCGACRDTGGPDSGRGGLLGCWCVGRMGGQDCDGSTLPQAPIGSLPIRSDGLPCPSPTDDDRQISSEDRRSVKLRVRPPPAGTHQCHRATSAGSGMMLTVKLTKS